MCDDASSFNIGTGYGAGKYDLSMAGPNRFLRRFQGDATKAGKSAEVSTRYTVEPGTGKLAVWFKMTNSGSAPVKPVVDALKLYIQAAPHRFDRLVYLLIGWVVMRQGVT